MIDKKLTVLSAMVLCLGAGNAFAGIADDLGFKAATGDDAVQGQDNHTITKGKIGDRDAKYVNCPDCRIDAIYVEMGTAKTFQEAYKACAELEPKGSWRLPNPTDAMVSLYNGITGPVKIDDKSALPPSLWAQGGSEEQNAQLAEKGTAAMTFRQGIVGITKDGQMQIGYSPAFFDVAETIKGNEHRVQELEEQLAKADEATPEQLGLKGLAAEKLDAEKAKLLEKVEEARSMTPESLAEQGIAGVTQEKIDEYRQGLESQWSQAKDVTVESITAERREAYKEQLKAQIENSKKTVTALKGDPIPVRCVSGQTAPKKEEKPQQNNS